MHFRSAVIILFSALPISYAEAQTSTSVEDKLKGLGLNAITTAVPFLMIAPDSRAGAMGDAGVASSPDANSIHWNPSKFAFIDKEMGFSLSYTPWLKDLVPDINLAYLTGYKKLEKQQAIAFSLLYFSLGNIDFTNADGTPNGSFKPHEFTFDAAYSRKLGDNFSGGLALRYIFSNLTGGELVENVIATKAGQSVAADLSAYYENDVKLDDKDGKLAFGVNISNIGARMSYSETGDKDFIPINLRLGSSLKIDVDNYNSVTFLLDMNKLLVPTPPVYQTDSVTGAKVIVGGKDPNVPVPTGMIQSFSDAPGGGKEEFQEISFSAGFEYWYAKQFAARAGYFFEHPNKGDRQYITFGVGLKYNVFGLDFAYLVPTGGKSPLQNTLRFTLLFDFDAFKDQNRENDAE